MDFGKYVMESFAEAWMAAATVNSNFFSTVNGGFQNQALSLTTSPPTSVSAEISPTNQGKTISVKCVVISVSNLQQWEGQRGGGMVEVEQRAHIPPQTVFQKVLDVVLATFGYPKEVAATAKGCILIENWAPIKLDKVAVNSLKTVSEIFGQLSPYITLQIHIVKPNSANPLFAQMKEKLLQLLVIQNREQILSSGCPLDQATLKNILRGIDFTADSPAPSDDMCRKFELWMAAQYRHALRPTSAPFMHPPPYHHQPTSHPAFAFHYPPQSQSQNLSRNKATDSHPALQTIQSQYPTQKTRMRTSFDPELELPKLQKWFSENQHPSRQQIQQYVNELNSLGSRTGRKPLDVNNVVYWFKNARAAQKRAQVRGYASRINGYNGSCSPMSDCEDIMDDGEGEISLEGEGSLPPSSPTTPLSLTTHNNNEDDFPCKTILTEVKHEPTSESPTKNSPKEKAASPEKDSPDSMSEDEMEEDEILSDQENQKEIKQESPSPSQNNCLTTAGYPLVANYPGYMSYMSQYMPGLRTSPAGTNSQDDRRKRNRTFIDPVSEVPCLERWFMMNTHPSHTVIEKYTDELNMMPYRQKFPRLETKNVQFWFKNRRAKCKRLKTSLYDNAQHISDYHQLAAALSNENSYRNSPI